MLVRTARCATRACGGARAATRWSRGASLLQRSRSSIAASARCTWWWRCRWGPLPKAGTPPLLLPLLLLLLLPHLPLLPLASRDLDTLHLGHRLVRALVHGGHCLLAVRADLWF